MLGIQSNKGERREHTCRKNAAGFGAGLQPFAARESGGREIQAGITQGGKGQSSRWAGHETIGRRSLKIKSHSKVDVMTGGSVCCEAILKIQILHHEITVF